MRVIIQEADDDFRKQIVVDFNSDNRFAVIKVFKSLFLLLDEMTALQADVLILNWQHHRNFLFYITNIRNTFPTLKIIVTFDFVQPDFIFQLQQQGVHHFLIKPFALDDVLNDDVFFKLQFKLQFHVALLSFQ